MATVGTNYLGIADLLKQQEGDGSITAQVIELLAQMNPVLAEAHVEECNNGTKHLTTTRAGYPTPTWRRLYQSVQPTKSTVAQVEDTTAMAEAWSEIDKELVELAKDKAQFRLNESMAFLEGMRQEVASKLFYGNSSTNPEQFHGLAPRFNAISTTADTAGYQVIDGGGSGSDRTSIWFIVWGPSTVHLLYPEGTTGGIQREDKGVQTKESTSGVFDVVREKFMWRIGLSVRDFRYVVRIANVDVSDALDGTMDLGAKMRSAYWRLKQREIPNGRAAIYCNADILEALDAYSTASHSTPPGSAAAIRLTPDNVFGGEVLSYRGIPLRQTDALHNAEADVPGP